MGMGVPSHKSSVIKSGKVDCTSDRRRQSDQQLDQPIGETSNKNTKVEREGRLETRRRSTTWRCDAVGPGSDDTTSQQGRPAGGESREEKGIEDRKEETAREMEEQRALYIRAK